MARSKRSSGSSRRSASARSDEPPAETAPEETAPAETAPTETTPTEEVPSVRTDADESRDMHVRIGFSVEAADAIFQKHGYVTMTLLSQMDDKEVENLCKVLRRPGGGTTNTTGSGRSATSVTKANLGEEVSIVAEKRLKVVSFIARHFLERVSKPIDFSDVTTELVDEFTPIKKEEDSYVFPYCRV